MAPHLLRPASERNWEKACALAELDTDPTDDFTLVKNAELFGPAWSEFLAEQHPSRETQRQSPDHVVELDRGVVRNRVDFGIDQGADVAESPLERALAKCGSDRRLELGPGAI